MMWNELNYDNQLKVIGLIEDLLLEQTDIGLQDALVAAMVELETWSNSPCPVHDIVNNEPYIAIATDPFPEEL